MSLSERKESIIAQLVSIDRQALLRTEKKQLTWAERKEEEAKQKAIEIYRKTLIESNWNEIKPLVFNSLKKINESVLNNSGTLLSWKRSNECHEHFKRRFYQNKEGYWDSTVEHLLDLEFTGLKVRSFYIFVERVFSSRDHNGKYEINEKNPREFYIHSGSNPDIEDNSSKFSLIFDKNDSQKLINSVEDAILDCIVVIYQGKLDKKL